MANLTDTKIFGQLTVSRTLVVQGASLTLNGEVINPARIAEWDSGGSSRVTGVSGTGNSTLTLVRDGETNLTTNLAHTHGNITNTGAIGITSGLMIKTTTSGVLTALAAGSAGQFLKHDGNWGTPSYTVNTDTNYYPTGFAWTAGGVAGPTGKLTMSGTTDVSFAAIPIASATASGIVTTGAQTFAGVKTFSSAIIANITGNVSGSSGSCTGNAATASSAASLTGAQATAITSNTSHRGVTTGNPHSVTKSDVGLSNVPNTNIAYSSVIAADAFTSAEVENLRAAKLDNGTTPWTSNNHYDNDDVDSHLSGGTGITYSSGAISLTAGYGDSLNPYVSKATKLFLATPNAAAGVPSFRAISASDIPTLNQSTTGNAATATKLATTRNIALTGSVTGSANFDGSGNISITTTTAHTHSYLPLAGGTMTGDIIFGTANRDCSPMGTYESSKTQQIWSMGAAYRNHPDGTNFGSLYGFAYKHTNNATGGTMAGGHQAIWAQAGVAKVALGDGIWTSGDITGTIAASNVTEISNLTAAEGAQLENIGSVTISNTQWGYVGGLNQDLTSTSTVSFTKVTASLTGNVTGNVTGSSGSCTGNAATATKLATARNIGGVSFDGSASIDLPGVNTAGSQNTSGSAGSVATSLTFNNGGSGNASGITFNGATARTISYNTIGAQKALTGATSDLTANNLTANRALISNASGKVVVSSITATELGYLDGATGNLQAQITDLSSSGSSIVTYTNNVTLATASNTVNILDGSPGFTFNSATDTLMVFENYVYLMRNGVDYTISGNTIVTTGSNFIAAEYNFIVFKNINYAAGSGASDIANHMAATSAHGATASATPNTIAMRDASGELYATKVYNAVWNDIVDFIELPEDIEIEYGKVYTRDSNSIRKANKRDKFVLGVASDTYGFGVGKDEKKNQIPIAIGGWVLVHIDKVYPFGTPLTYTENGCLTKANLLTRIFHSYKIIATFDRVEKEEKWNGVKVKNRHWAHIL